MEHVVISLLGNPFEDPSKETIRYLLGNPQKAHGPFDVHKQSYFKVEMYRCTIEEHWKTFTGSRKAPFYKTKQGNT